MYANIFLKHSVLDSHRDLYKLLTAQKIYPFKTVQVLYKKY